MLHNWLLSQPSVWILLSDGYGNAFGIRVCSISEIEMLGLGCVAFCL